MEYMQKFTNSQSVYSVFSKTPRRLQVFVRVACLQLPCSRFAYTVKYQLQPSFWRTHHDFIRLTFAIQIFISFY